MTLSSYEFIANLDQVDHMIKHLEGSKEIGIDIESNSMYRYYPKICLMQIATGDKVFLVDIDKMGLPNKIEKLLLDNGITKTFQDLQYDLALFEFQFSIKPQNMFDISIADKLIRQDHNMRSLERLVKDYLDKDISTSRSVQKSNWCNRPLTEKQISYAVKDTALILPIKHEQEKAISDGIRDRCLSHYLDHFPIIDLSKTYNLESMWKIKGIHSLDQEQLGQLQNLLLTRLDIAKKIDRPIHWIAKDRSLLEAVRKYPISLEQFKRIIGRKRLSRVQRRSVDQLYSAFGEETPPERIEPPGEGISLRRWTNSSNNFTRDVDSKAISEIKNWVRLVASNTQLLPEFILTRDDVIDLVSSNEQEVEFRGIPDKFIQLFKTDYYYFTMTGESTLDYSDLASRI